MIPKRGCALYTQLRSIHYFKGLDKGASYIRVRLIHAKLRYMKKYQRKVFGECMVNLGCFTVEYPR